MRQKWISALLHAATLGSALMCGAIALLVIGFLVRQGCPEFWACVLPGGAADGRSEQADYLHMAWLPALWNTLFMIVAVLLPAIPIGTGAAIFLTEYASRGQPLCESGQPCSGDAGGNTVHFVWAFWFFAVRPAAGLGVFLSCRCVHAAADGAAADHSHCAGGTADDSCGQREASFGLGAGKGRTALHVLLPAAFPGMLAGILLAVGRITGESAALLFTAGTGGERVDSVFSSAATLAVALYAMMVEGRSLEGAYQTALVCCC